MFRQDFPAGFDAGPVRKADVHLVPHQAEDASLLLPPGPCSRFSHDRDALIIVQNGSQADANHFMVVDEKQPDRRGFRRRKQLTPRRGRTDRRHHGFTSRIGAEGGT